ncbi:MAG: E3 ubiquitin-protein ligase sspH2 [Chlamydiae bacterium]|nr:E3 ubiquitin-protein ligase sspH2 [Chlamydiota bacterium]
MTQKVDSNLRVLPRHEKIVADKGVLSLPDELWMLIILRLPSFKDQANLALAFPKLYRLCKDYSLWKLFAKSLGIRIAKVKVIKNNLSTPEARQKVLQEQFPKMVIKAVRGRFHSMPDSPRKTQLIDRLKKPMTLSALEKMHKFRHTLIVYSNLAEQAKLPFRSSDTKNQETLNVWFEANKVILKKRVEKLNLEKKQLTYLPESLGEMRDLKELNLSANGLTLLPKFLHKFSSLEKLDLSDNRLSILPEFLGELTSLKTLYLGLNELTVLPESLGKLRSLRRLSLSINKLSSLPDFFGQFNHLITLDLGFNRLTTLPMSLGTLSSLKFLTLVHNRLTTLPLSCGELNSLLTIYLTGNQIKKIPPSLVNRWESGTLFIDDKNSDRDSLGATRSAGERSRINATD